MIKWCIILLDWQIVVWLRWMGEYSPKAVQCISYRPMVYLFESADPNPSTWTQPSACRLIMSGFLTSQRFYHTRTISKPGNYLNRDLSNHSKLSHSSSVRLAKYRSQERCCVLCHISNSGLHILRKLKKAELTYCTMRLFTTDMNGDAHQMS